MYILYIYIFVCIFTKWFVKDHAKWKITIMNTTQVKTLKCRWGGFDQNIFMGMNFSVIAQAYIS